MLNEKWKLLAAEVSLGEESKPTMRNTRGENNAVRAKGRTIIFLKGRGGGMNNFPLKFFFLFYAPLQTFISNNAFLPTNFFRSFLTTSCQNKEVLSLLPSIII